MEGKQGCKSGSMRKYSCAVAVNRSPKTVKLFWLIILLFSLIGCREKSVVRSNEKAAEDLVLAAKIYTKDGDYIFPKSMDELISDKFLHERITCKCQDKIERDFVWLAGYSGADSGRCILFYSPDQMDAKLTIVARLNGEVEVLEKGLAESQIKLCEAYLKRVRAAMPGDVLFAPEI
jgi:hypothetical protein